MAKPSFCGLRTICRTLLLIVCLLALASAGWGANKPAPDFTLKDVLQGMDFSLSQYRGQSGDDQFLHLLLRSLPGGDAGPEQNQQ